MQCKKKLNPLPQSNTLNNNKSKYKTGRISLQNIPLIQTGQFGYFKRSLFFGLGGEGAILGTQLLLATLLTYKEPFQFKSIYLQLGGG